MLDNFEQLLAAAPLLATMLSAAPAVSFLVTSRSRLRLSGERTFDLHPLGVPELDRPLDAASAAAVPAMQLFVERSRAVKPDFELTPANVDAVAGIVVALDGLPLALELAAARIRVLSPTAMLKRLDKQLPLLVEGVRDLPERQRTLRSTIEWSTRLLGADEARLLARLGVFSGAFSLEAVEDVWAAMGETTDALTLLGSLVDDSLVRQQDRGDSSLFSLLATVREYAAEQLVAAAELDALRRVHAAYYVRLSERARPDLTGPEQGATVRRLADEHENLRAAVRWLIDTGDVDAAARFAWNLYIYWWVGGRLGEVCSRMLELLESGRSPDDLGRAIALYFTHAVTFWKEPGERVIPGLQESARLFEEQGERSGAALALISLALAHLTAEQPDPQAAAADLDRALELVREADERWGEAMTLVMQGRVALLSQQVPDALERFSASLAIAAAEHDGLGITIALHHRGWAYLLLQDVEQADASFQESLATSARLGHAEGVAYGLEGLVAIAATRGDVERAGRLAGAAKSLRERSGLYNAPTFSFHDGFLEPIRASAAADTLASAIAAGERMTPEEAVALALPGPDERRTP